MQNSVLQLRGFLLSECESSPLLSSKVQLSHLSHIYNNYVIKVDFNEYVLIRPMFEEIIHYIYFLLLYLILPF